MFPPIRYLEFAQTWFGKIRYDLATSGLAPISADELGTPAHAPSDYSARGAFAAAVAERYAVPEAEVVPVLGSSGGLFTAMATLLERGQRVLVEQPGYEPMWRVPEALGLSVDRFERQARNDHALDVDQVLDALRPDTRLVAITNPSNPTASLVDDATLARLAHALGDRWLLVDEAYLELARPRHSARRLAPNLVTCASTTKCWGVPWARAGWLLLPAEHAEPARRVERHVAGVAPPGSFAWGALALAEAERLAERACQLQAGKRELVDDFVARHSASLHWTPPPETSPYGWLVDRRGRSLRPLVERGIATLGVIVSPGEFFGEPGAFRMSWTAPREALEEGLRRIATALEL